jgi:hypothetical protein
MLFPAQLHAYLTNWSSNLWNGRMYPETLIPVYCALQVCCLAVSCKVYMSTAHHTITCGENTLHWTTEYCFVQHALYNTLPSLQTAPGCSIYAAGHTGHWNANVFPVVYMTDRKST